MAPVDPGSAIQWQKTPAHTARLLAAVAALPTRADQHAVFSSAVRRSAQFKADRQTALDAVTAATFDAAGDEARRQKQVVSVQKRLAA